jgi:hypothetical protein
MATLAIFWKREEKQESGIQGRPEDTGEHEEHPVQFSVASAFLVACVPRYPATLGKILID